MCELNSADIIKRGDGGGGGDDQLSSSKTSTLTLNVEPGFGGLGQADAVGDLAGVAAAVLGDARVDQQTAVLHHHPTLHPQQVADLDAVVEPPVGDVGGQGLRLADELHAVALQLGEVPRREGDDGRPGDDDLRGGAHGALAVPRRTAVLADVVQLNAADAKLVGEDVHIGVALQWPLVLYCGY